MNDKLFLRFVTIQLINNEPIFMLEVKIPSE